MKPIRVPGIVVDNIDDYLLYRGYKVWYAGDQPEYSVGSKCKTARTIIREKARKKCELCGKKGEHMHHMDRDRSNNAFSNLIFLCRICHYLEHKRIRKNPNHKPELPEDHVKTIQV